MSTGFRMVMSTLYSTWPLSFTSVLEINDSGIHGSLGIKLSIGGTDQKFVRAGAAEGGAPKCRPVPRDHNSPDADASVRIGAAHAIGQYQSQSNEGKDNFLHVVRSRGAFCGLFISHIGTEPNPEGAPDGQIYDGAKAGRVTRSGARGSAGLYFFCRLRPGLLRSTEVSQSSGGKLICQNSGDGSANSIPTGILPSSGFPRETTRLGNS